MYVVACYSNVKKLIIGAILSVTLVLPFDSFSASLSINRVQATDVTGTSAVISWSLNQRATGYVQYGRSRNGMHQESKKETSFRYSAHKQNITGLRPRTTYYYRVHSTTKNNNKAVSSIASFRTPAADSSTSSSSQTAPAVSSQKLKISNVRASKVTGNAAIIEWDLNQVGTGIVDYGTTYTLSDSTKKETSFKFGSHKQTISGLKADTTYYYRVRSEDKSKNEVKSVTSRFTTASVPMKVSNVKTDVSGNNVVFKWDLNQNGTGFVEYGKSRNFGATSKEEKSFKFDSHRQEVYGLNPNSTYYYRVRSTNKHGQEIASNTYSFKTGGAIAPTNSQPTPATPTTPVTPTSTPKPSPPSNVGAGTAVSSSWPRNTNGDLPMAGIFYGNYMSGVGAQNAAIALESSRRIRAEKSGTLTHVVYNNRTLNMYNITSRCERLGPESDWCKCMNNGLDQYTCGYTLGSSYSVGNGGKIVVEVRTNTSKGTPSNVVLGKTVPFVPLDNAKKSFPELKFTTPVRIQEGQIYHLVFTNLNPPTTCSKLVRISPKEASKCPRNQGAIGLNGPRMLTWPSTTGLGGPYLGDEGAANLFRRSKSSGWSSYKTSLAWYELRYSDGVAVGDSYTPLYAMSEARHAVQGSTKARQIFNVKDATRHVDGMWLKFGHTKTADGSPLSVVLKNQSGTILAKATIKASTRCIKTANDPSKSLGQWCQDWARATFNKSVKLVKGSRYSVELSSGPKGGFDLIGYHTYRRHGMKSRNEWLESRVELSKNGGSSWGAWSNTYASERDLPLLFTIVGMPKQMR